MPTVWEESREVDYSRDRVQVVRRFRVEPYSFVDEVTFALLGGVELIGGWLVRFPPASDPGIPYCYCVNCKITGGGKFHNETQSPSNFNILADNAYYDWGIVTATYTTLDVDPVPSPAGGMGGAGGSGVQPGQSSSSQDEINLASETWEYGVQNLTLKNDRWKWEGGNDLTSQTDLRLTKAIPTATYTFARHFVINLPRTAITWLLGRVNFNPISKNYRVQNVTTSYQFPPETIRFDGVSAQRRVTNRGVHFFEVTYKFAFNTIFDATPSGADFVGWNRFFREDTGYWEYPVLAADPDVYVFQHDEDAPSQSIAGQSVRGFHLLFHPGAS